MKAEQKKVTNTSISVFISGMCTSVCMWGGNVALKPGESVINNRIGVK